MKAIHLKSRDNARTMMQWDNSEFAGFSGVKPWLKVNSNKEYINVDANKVIKDFFISLAFTHVVIDDVKEKHESAHFCTSAYLMKFDY